MIETEIQEPGNIVVAKAYGVLSRQDIEGLVKVAGTVGGGSARVLIELDERAVWSQDGLATFFNVMKDRPVNVSKMALVGSESETLNLGQVIANHREYPIIPFPVTQFQKALQWLRED